MNRYVIVDGLPYLIADDGKTYAVRWDNNGFTVGHKVNVPYVPAVKYSELSIKAKCKGKLDSIGATTEKTKTSKKRKDDA